MKNILFYFLILLNIGSVLPLKAQTLIKNSSVTGVCYAGDKIKKIYIPPPTEFYKKAGSKSGGSITIYYTGFPYPAKAAMEYARTILESMLPADAKFTILASWEEISTAGVLGNSSVNGYALGTWIDALNPMAFYPVALAEKIAGKSLNEDAQGDLTLRINNTMPWYLGTDGQTPGNKYDLITVVLHEICHGLGFFDSMTTNSTIAGYGISSIPMIYDTFIENFAGKKLTDTLEFKNPSSSLRSQLIGEQLYFNGPLLNKYSQQSNYSPSRAKLWAPSTWDAGSSISHLDEYVTPDSIALMTPYINYGEAIHNPGKYIFSILGDLGWINTRIIHKPMADTEKNLSSVELSAIIKSDTLYDRDKVVFVYSYDKFISSDTIYMTSPNSNDTFKVSVVIPSYNTELQYYFYAEDCFLRLYRSPSLSDSIRYKVFVGKDIIKPVITHIPVVYYLESTDTININATVTDNLGVDSVYIEYIINNGTSQYLGLSAVDNDNYSTLLNTRLLNIVGGDSLRYRIFATDSAMVPNTTVLPLTGYFTTSIEDISTTLDRYSTDFTGTAGSDFFNIGFSIMKPFGFSKFGLHTKHPYESPGVNDQSIEYTSLLRHPLKFNESGIIINFRELVLVEPGEPGSVFGSSDFYDYVVVEGSNDFGKTWFNMINGYDSRYVKSWETSYNSLVVSGDSKYIGKESMLLKHTIFYRPSDKISAGDTLMLRFRLFSDPLSNGWGWVIEDLNINSLIDGVEDIGFGEIIIYPNPGPGLIRIKTDNGGVVDGKPTHYSIFGSTGICVKNDQTLSGSDTFVDISDFSPGIYSIVFYRDDGIKTIKYILLK